METPGSICHQIRVPSANIHQHQAHARPMVALARLP